MSTKDLVNAIIVGDAVEIENAFQATMAEKISSRLDDYRQEVAQNMFKTEEAELEEAFDPHKKAHPNGGVVGTAVDYFNKNAEGKPRLTVFLKPNRDPNKIQRGRMKTYDISHHYDEKEADQAKKDYAKKFGYHAMTKLGEDVELDEEQLDELSKGTLGSYIKKAGQHRVRLAGAERDLDDKDTALQRAKHGADDATYDALSKAQDTMRKQRYKVSDKSQQRAQGISRAVNRLTKEEAEQILASEEFEQLDEISKATLTSYISKAAADVSDKRAKSLDSWNKYQDASVGSVRRKNAKDFEKHQDAAEKRAGNIGKAAAKLSKATESVEIDEEQLDELSKSTLSSYIKKATSGTRGVAASAYETGAKSGTPASSTAFKTTMKRIKGVEKASDKLAKEDVEQLVVTTVESALYALEDGRTVLDEQLTEAVSSSSKDNYEWTHGNKPKGHGNWYFSTVHPRQHNFDQHKDQTVNVTGTFGDAAKKAQAHFKEKGHKGEIHVLT